MSAELMSEHGFTLDHRLVEVAEAYGRMAPTIDKVSYLLWYVATEMVGGLGFDDCVVYGLDRVSGVLTQQAAFGDKSSGPGSIENRIEIPIGHGVTGYVAMTGKPVIVEDASQDPRYIVDLEPMRSEVAVPIMVGGSVFGVIDCEAPLPGAFGESHLFCLRMVASLIAPKLETLTEQAARSQSKQELIEQNLRLSVELETARNAARSVGRVQATSTLIRLSGGIAHDFNNQLAILRTALYSDERTPPNMAMANDAINRAAELTNRLLAFSSQQALSPRSINLADVVSQMEGLLQESIEDGIMLSSSLAEDLWDVHVDVGSLEQTLVGLVFNASDALPDGGSIKISCSNVELDTTDVGGALDLAPGEYVVMAVSDDGEGMSPEVKAQAFTPYFTTKGEEERVGLGLSIAYGFVRQSGGDARISSVEDEGTSVVLYFPRDQSGESVGDSIGGESSPASTSSSGPRRGRGQRILVIEDNQQLSGAMVNVLDLLGYSPILAESAAEGVERAAEAQQIDLLLVDAMLDNGQVGPDVYAEIVERVGDVPVIFMSGYADLARTRLGGRIGDRPFMSKPFTMEELAAKIYEVLDQ